MEGGMPLAVGDTPAAGMDVVVPNADDDDDGVVSGEASIGRDGPGFGSGPGSDVPAVADIRLKFVGKPRQPWELGAAGVLVLTFAALRKTHLLTHRALSFILDIFSS